MRREVVLSTQDHIKSVYLEEVWNDFHETELFICHSSLSTDKPHRMSLGPLLSDFFNDIAYFKVLTNLLTFSLDG